MGKAGCFASRLKMALTLDIAGPPVPELHDVPRGYHTTPCHAPQPSLMLQPHCSPQNTLPPAALSGHTS